MATRGAKRQGTRKIQGGPQGRDAYVLVRKPRYGERQPILEQIQALWDEVRSHDDERVGLADASDVDYRVAELMADGGFFLEWNLVDDDDEPLPQPTNAEAIRELLADEVRWLINEAVSVLSGVDLEKK